ncbi:MAG: hypothetical protein OEZ06_28950 [Myxococcales bacterium]|nr:hypothetical protein [Myxococcales bacterium]
MGHGPPSRFDASELHREVIELARVLTPAIVDFGPDTPRFDAFMECQPSGQDAPKLGLTAIAARFLPPKSSTGVRILWGQHGMRSGLWATDIVARGGHSAMVDLRRARPLTALEAADLPQAAGCFSQILALVIAGAVSEAGNYVFPIAEVTRQSCWVWSTEPFEPGRRFAHVCVIADARMVRRGRVEARSAHPWYGSDGKATFLCEFVFIELEADATDNAPYSLVSDPRRVRRLLDFAAMRSARGSYEAPGWGRGIARFKSVERDCASLELVPQANAEALPATPLRLTVELFAESYEMELRALDIEADGLRVALPLLLRQRPVGRRDELIEAPHAQPPRLSFRNPVTATTRCQQLRAASFFAVEFEVDAADASLWEQLPLEAARIEYAGRLVELGPLEIDGFRARGEYRTCVATISDPGVAEAPAMIELLASWGHPDVHTHDGESFRQLHDIYLRARLFGPHMHRNLEPIMEKASEVWLRMHAQAGDVVRTLTHGPIDAPDGAVTVLRAWEHAWVMQHFVDVSPELNGAAGKLQLAYLDHLVPRPDGRYGVFFIKDDNRQMNAYLTRFFATTGTAEAVARSSVELWSHRGPASLAVGAVGAAASGSIRPLVPTDETLICRAATRTLGRSAAAALSMIPGELELPDTGRRYARAGLLRGRVGWIVEREGMPAFAILEEQATPGMNLTWMLNACWLLPLHPAAADAQALALALSHCLQLPAQTATGERFLNLPQGLDRAVLETAGFTCEAGVFMYVLNRAGLHRFYHYAAVRYGELHAMAGRRARRKQQRPESEA